MQHNISLIKILTFIGSSLLINFNYIEHFNYSNLKGFIGIIRENDIDIKTLNIILEKHTLQYVFINNIDEKYLLNVLADIYYSFSIVNLILCAILISALLLVDHNEIRRSIEVSKKVFLTADDARNVLLVYSILLLIVFMISSTLTCILFAGITVFWVYPISEFAGGTGLIGWNNLSTFFNPYLFYNLSLLISCFFTLISLMLPFIVRGLVLYRRGL